LNAFDTLQAQMKEAKAREQLERYTTPQLAKKIQEGNHNIALGGEKVRGVVLFSDLVGFTAMSERLSPEKIVERINQILKRMVNCIFQNEGSIDKFGGDSIMAHWNVLSKSEHPEREAVKTAISMQNHLFRYSLLDLEKGEELIQMGIGINAGDMVAGNIGTENRMDYTIIGETVNLASRLESKAGGGCTFVSPGVAASLNKDLLSILLKPTSFKNVAQPLPVHSIRGLRIRDGFLTSIPVRVNTKAGVKLGMLTQMNDKVAYMESDFKLKPERSLALDLWLPELPPDQRYKNQFTTVRVDVMEGDSRPIYRTKMLLGEGNLKDWLMSTSVESSRSGDEVPRVMKLT